MRRRFVSGFDITEKDGAVGEGVGVDRLRSSSLAAEGPSDCWRREEEEPGESSFDMT